MADRRFTASKMTPDKIRAIAVSLTREVALLKDAVEKWDDARLRIIGRVLDAWGGRKQSWDGPGCQWLVTPHPDLNGDTPFWVINHNPDIVENLFDREQREAR